jgi:hypothetical protein
MKFFIVFLTFFFSMSVFALAVSSSTYNGSVKTVNYTDGSSATFTPTKSKDTWATDNVTKTTTYTYADKTTYAVTSTVEPTVVKTLKGLVQTTTTTYGNKKKIVTTNTGVLVDGSQSVASNYSSKSGTYRFSDGSTSVISTTVSGSPKDTWATDNVTKTTTYKYADKTTYAVTSTVEPTVSVTWKADNITKSSKYVYGNGKTSTVVQTVNPVLAKVYSAGMQSIVTTYGNGYVTTATNTATSSPVSWASDHITKTITYNFADGTSNPVVSTVAPSVSTPTLTAAVYPSNWTSTGTVTLPRVSSLATTYGDGYVLTTENGTLSKPFNQTTLSAQSITDSNGYVESPTTTYNLTWGTPDKDGPSYAAAFNQGASSYTYPSPIYIWGNRVAGYNLAIGPTYAAPHQDVISAWNQGWTGKGVNVVIADSLMTNHGVITASLVGRYAYAANMYGIPLDNDMYTTTTNVFDTNGNYANLSNMINVGAINLSFGANYSYGTTAPARAIVDNAYSSLRNNWVNILKGTAGYIYQGLNMTDAVVIKSAGNDAISADKESFVKAYADDAAIKNRLLIAGALSYTLDGKGYIASYSNTAGDDTNVSGRFLVASGGTPFSYGDISINGTLANSSEFGNLGTSFAAPRVAGYVAIVRSKFPNLDAIKTSAIMLDTARYDTLSCYPSCSPSIYGAGEASLSRALAPIGRLR